MYDAAEKQGFDLDDGLFDWCLKLKLAPSFSSGTNPARINPPQLDHKRPHQFFSKGQDSKYSDSSLKIVKAEAF